MIVNADVINKNNDHTQFANQINQPKESLGKDTKAAADSGYFFVDDLKKNRLGHIKRNLSGDVFLLRGLKVLKSEFSAYANCFNISRMITMLGWVQKSIKALRGFYLEASMAFSQCAEAIF